MSRVFLSGSHSSGKTTLAKSLAEKLGWTYVGEAARSVIEKLGKPQGKSFSELIDFQEAVFKAQKKAQKYEGVFLTDDRELSDNLVVDRSMVDVVAYLEWFYRQAKDVSAEDFKKYADLRLRILDAFYLSSEDQLIILPPPEKPEDDGVRFTDGAEEFHKLLMAEVWREFDRQSDFHKKVLRIEERGTPEEYLEKAVNFVLRK